MGALEVGDAGVTHELEEGQEEVGAGGSAQDAKRHATVARELTEGRTLDAAHALGEGRRSKMQE